MKSKVVFTDQIDDPQAVADALSEQVKNGMALEKNSVGILMCYADMELDALLSALTPLLPFDIIGCTCIASMEQSAGFHEIAASLLVMTADDCTFQTVTSAPIAPGNVRAQVAAAYGELSGKLQGAPKLLYAIAPYNLAIMLDEYTEAFNEVVPGVPVIGGLPSYNANGDTNATFAEGAVYLDRMVLLGIAGNIRPLFSVCNVTGSVVERKRKVTQATDNTVHRVGTQAFADYMRDIGFPVDSLTGNDTVLFVSNPLLLENVKLDGGEDFSFVRTLHKIDLEEGSGTAIGKIPEGATLSVCSLDKADIETAAGEGMQALAAKITAAQAADDYAYTTVLSVSCIGRYTLMLPDGETETNRLLSVLPAGLTLFGFYGYGEIGPLSMDAQHTRNFAHNESLVLCAI